MSPLAIVNVEQGKRYRFRVIGASCDSWFNFTIDGHKMTIIEVDGTEIIPVHVDSLAVFAGQRYSVVVTADRPVNNYWIRALADFRNKKFDGGQNSAILRYRGAPDEDPITEPGPYVLPFSEGSLQPLFGAGAPGIPEPGKADVNINLVPGFNITLGDYTLNNISFIEPPLPILLQILSGKQHPSQLLPSGSIYELPSNKTIEVSIPATDLSPGGALGVPVSHFQHGIFALWADTARVMSTPFICMV